MPRRDGSGPMGAGSMTGRGIGPCAGTNADKKGSNIGMGAGFGLACRRGFGGGSKRVFGRCFDENQNSDKTQKELLQEQKGLLQNRLEVIDKQLETL